MLSTDVRNWTLFDIGNWTRGSGFVAPGSVLGWLIQVVHRRDLRASRSALTSDGAARAGGPCGPTWASLAHAGTAAAVSATAGALNRPDRRFSRSRLTVAADRDDVAVVQQPLEDCGRDDRIAEYCAPLADRAIAGDLIGNVTP